MSTSPATRDLQVVGPSGVVASRLRRELGLFDVFAVSTGAMFSSGFFLLPGLAYAQAGPAVVLAYLLAGVFILPAMFSAAELSTALPRAGGAYYFLDRSLGPMAGTVGGLGTYLALTLKTAFALIGIGAYAAFFVDLPIRPVAIALTVVFVVVNILGAKETTTLQRWLVLVLLTVMALFAVMGLVHAAGRPLETTAARFSPFLAAGPASLLATVGFVFVSYAGLTKVASIAEEVRDPERNLPLGMILSLAVTSVVYVVGVAVIVAVVEPAALRSDLTPVATAAEALGGATFGRIALLLVVVAAFAAFASTGNAGMLAASRYPLAMARDRLLPARFAQLGRFRTPVPAILATGALMIGFILLLDAEGIAKLASAFQLLIFVLVNFAVIVMRESRIQSYDPGYRSPLYPWMQIFGMGTSILLIVAMGPAAIGFTIAVVVVCLVWYRLYAARRVQRRGAIRHWFSRLGQRTFDGLDREFRGIMKEKGLRAGDPFDEIVARSAVLDRHEPATFPEIIELASLEFAQRLPVSANDIRDRFMQGTLVGHTPVTHGVALPHFRTTLVDRAEMVLIRTRHAVDFPADDPLTAAIEPAHPVHAVFCLVSPEHDPALHLRILAQVAGRVDEPTFADAWLTAPDDAALRTVLLRDDRCATLRLRDDAPAAALADVRVRDAGLPEGCLIAVVRRDAEMIVPDGATMLRAGDELTVIGATEAIAALRRRYPQQSPAHRASPCLHRDHVRELEHRLLAVAARSADREPRRVRDAVAALRRMAGGTYGTCLGCGAPIALSWLLLRPEAGHCLECRSGGRGEVDGAGE